MLLRLIVCIGLDMFCVWQGLQAAAIATPDGRHYFPAVYIFCIVLLSSGLNKFGLISWPVTTILLLLYGHWIVGWIPLALVLFTVWGNKTLDRMEDSRSSADEV